MTRNVSVMIQTPKSPRRYYVVLYFSWWILKGFFGTLIMPLCLLQDAWQCSECRKFNSATQRYCMRCWALRKDWYKDCTCLAHAVSVPDLPDPKDEDDGIDVPDCPRTVSDPVILPSHWVSRDLPASPASAKGKAPRRVLQGSQESQEGREVMLEPCRLCRVRPRDGNIIHGRTAHMLTCFPCARKLHKCHAPCPGCGQIIQKVIKMFVAWQLKKWFA